MIIGIQFAHNNTKVIRGVLGYTKGNETALIEQTNENAGSPIVITLSVRPSVRPSKFVRKHFRSGTIT